MVPRVACLENSWAKSFGFPENSRQGAPRTSTFALFLLKHDISLRWRLGLLCHFQERAAAKKLFLTPDGLMTQLGTTLSTTVSTKLAKPGLTLDEPKPMAQPGKAGRLMTKDEREKVKVAIAGATSMEEIRRLERQLREGYVPEIESVGA